MSSHEGVRVDLAEDALAYSFHDHELGVGALSTWRDGFSRLEFLGDSILGLAVFATAEAAGWVRELAMDRVDNEHLDRLFDQRLRRCTTSHTGDVEVEAVRTKAANRLERVVGKRFLLSGWTAAHLTAVDLLELRGFVAT